MLFVYFLIKAKMMRLTNRIIKGFSSVTQVLANSKAHKFKLG